MINVYKSKLDVEPAESHEYEGNLLEWFDENVGHDRRPKPLWSVFLNNEILVGYEELNIDVNKNDSVDIFIEPRGVGVFFTIIVAASAAYAFYRLSNIPDNYASSVPAGSSIYNANAQANTPRLNGLITELFGTHPHFPDLLNATPRRYYNSNDEYIDLLLCIGVGEYTLEQLLIGETDVSRYAGDISYQMYGPGDDVSGHSAHKNWYQSKEVQNLKLETVSEVLSSDYTGDFDGTELSVYDDSTPSSFPVEVGEIFEINTGSNAGLYEVEALTSNPETVECQRMQSQVNGNNIVYVEDEDWTGFITESGITMDWKTITGGENWKGPFALCPDGETSDEFEFDIIFPRGLAKSSSSGSLTTKTVQISVEWRDLDVAGSYTEVNSLSTVWSAETTDELGFTVNVQVSTSAINLSGYTIDDFTDTYNGVEVTGYKITATGNPFGEIVVNHQVVLTSFADTSINTSYYIRQKDDDNTIYLTLTAVESSFVSAISSTVLSGSEQIQVTAVRPEVRFKRVTPEATDQNTIDEVRVSRIRSLLETKTTFDDITTLAMTLKGTNAVANSAQNKINGYFTRKIPIIDSGGLSASNEETSDIAPVVAYLMTNAGYSYSDIDSDALEDLNASCITAGQTFKSVMNDDITLFDALTRVLLCGYAEPTIEEGKLLPVRDEPRLTYDYLYTPEKITGDISRTMDFYKDADTDGVLVEYYDTVAKKPETVLCIMPDQTGTKPEKFRAFGVTDRTQAWRIGMRLARKQWFKPIQFKFKTELDALNSQYGSSDAICDDLIKDSFQGVVVDIDSTLQTITLDKDVTFATGTNSIAFTKPDGSMSTVFNATAGSAANEIDIDSPIDFTFYLDGTMDPPSFTFGKSTEFFKHVITKKIEPSGGKVSVVAEEYIDEIYDDDDGNPDYGPAKITPPGGGGDDWGQLSTNSLDSGAGTGATATAIEAYGANIFVAAYGAGYASISTDAGLTWTALIRGLNSGSTTSTINDISINEDGYGVAVMESGYAARTTDGGLTWSSLTRWLNSGTSNTSIDISGVAYNGATFVAVLDSGYAAISTDNGATWSALTRGLNSGAVSTNFAAISSDRVNGFVVMSSFRGSYSGNNGVTWTPLTAGLGNAVSQGLIPSGMDGSFSGTYICSRNLSHFDRSTDPGSSWSALTRGLSSGDTNNGSGGVANDGGDVWVCAFGDKACVSFDDGLTFENLPNELNSNDAQCTVVCTNRYGVWISGHSGGKASRSPAP